MNRDGPASRTFAAPQELRERQQWLCWRYEKHRGEKKPRKMPYYANGGRRRGEQGSDKDRAQLVMFDQAAAAAHLGEYSGVGFAFLPGDGLIGIDLDNAIDLETGEVAERAQKIIDACASYTEYSPSEKGVHIFVAATMAHSFKSNEIGVEVFCGGQFFTFTGRHYPGAPETVNPIDDKVLRRLRATVEKAKSGQRRQPAALSAHSGAGELPARAKIESALAFISPDCGYDDWIAIGMGIHAEIGAPGLDVWDYWSSKCVKYPGRKTLETHWNSFDGAGGITSATLYKMAHASGWLAPRTPRRAREPHSAQSAAEEQPLPAEYSEDRIARLFTKRHGADWRYVAAWGRWLYWNGQRWCVDETLRHFDLARLVCRDVANEVRNSTLKNKDRIAALIESARTVAAVLKFAAADRVHAAEVSDWDRDPWLLNTPAGLVDLRTGRVEMHRRDAYCTKITMASPQGRCPRWFRFLARITGGDRRLIAYLQRLIGYAVTGITQEHVLAFLYGTGANGKSTFLNAVAGAIGDYAQTASMETFVESHADRHPADLAMLRGARLVIGQETEEGQRWAASRIKSMTGGDSITARLMRQDFFTYVPMFLLLLAGNHKPILRNVDEAMRRRLHLIPFTQCIPANERDKGLAEKLRAEWGGILAWAIRGCLRWQRLGLRPPVAVRNATDLYLQDEDILEAWIAECVQIDNVTFAATKQLHASYQAWAERSREKFYGVKRFGQLLEERGYTRERTAIANGFRGLKLIAQETEKDLLG